MKAAYYRRNNSYSRSYNAENAEAENRFPLTRAAQFMGLSLAAFKGGCKVVGYVATEWHHVSKYANRVTYYDCVELDTIRFWKAATTKANKAHCISRIKELVNYSLSQKLTAIPIEKQVQIFHVDNYEFKFIGEPTTKNLNKAIGMAYLILKKRTTNYPPHWFIQKPNHNGIEYFFLNPDGSIVGCNGKSLFSSQIDWDRYKPVCIGSEGGVKFHFIHHPKNITNENI